MTAIVSGRPGLREFFSRLVRWRFGIRWYAIALITPILIPLIAVGLLFCFVNTSQVSPFSTDKLLELPASFLFILLFIGLGEEPGWRGFALPQLQVKHTSLIASLILAPIWAFWHLPLFGNEFPWPIVAPFVLSVFGGTCVLTWVFNGARGSVLLTMLFHAALNTVSSGLIFPLFSGATLVTLWWIYSFVWLFSGLGLLSLNTSRT